jgi:hypothetical protein
MININLESKIVEELSVTNNEEERNQLNYKLRLIWTKKSIFKTLDILTNYFDFLKQDTVIYGEDYISVYFKTRNVYYDVDKFISKLKRLNGDIFYGNIINKPNMTKLSIPIDFVNNDYDIQNWLKEIEKSSNYKGKIKKGIII